MCISEANSDIYSGKQEKFFSCVDKVTRRNTEKSGVIYQLDPESLSAFEIGEVMGLEITKIEFVRKCNTPKTKEDRVQCRKVRKYITNECKKIQ